MTQEKEIELYIKALELEIELRVKETQVKNEKIHNLEQIIFSKCEEVEALQGRIEKAMHIYCHVQDKDLPYDRITSMYAALKGDENE